MSLNEGSLLKTLDIQDSGGTENTVIKAMTLIQEMIPPVAAAKREPVSAANLILGLECGGSDAYSGITANPSLGAAADLLVQDGGTVILSETPEIYGAEHLLIRRAVNCRVADKLIEKIKWWEAYTEKNGAQINNNPTPGNKDGGISTILEKSLGAVAKGGNTPLQEVYSYAEPVLSKGMVFMDTPGYDIVSITGMIAGGANMIGFTSGRGTVVGFKPVPCLKLASNTHMYDRMKGDMDINCGPVLDAGVSVKDMGLSIYKTILETASGSKSKSEIFGYGDHEFVPWHIGAVL
jgi:altronate dehydratase